MLFNSYIFLFLFLPLALAGWFGLHKLQQPELAKGFISLMSLWFYGYFNPWYLLIILGSILVNYLLSWLMNYSPGKKTDRFFLLLGITGNLAILFYFKYYDFFIENINILFRTDFHLKHILLPLGISFFTFQQLSFIIDRCTRKTGHYSFLNYLTFVTFFPQLIAGPIVLYKEIIPQLDDPEKRRFQVASFTRGLSLFILGLSKKVLLADVLALVTNHGFANTLYLDATSTLLVLLAYTFQIYFDFSGYSDMAMGLGWMFNLQLPINFNSPYKACSVKELWQRWHITLSRFFVTYVYIPLGGSKKGRARTLGNILVIFILSGLWHGANWTYVAWGTMQGLLVVWDNLGLVGVHERSQGIHKSKEKNRIKGSKEHKRDNGSKENHESSKSDRIHGYNRTGQHPRIRIPRWMGWASTFSFFLLSLIFFRSETMSDALRMFYNILFIGNTGYIHKLAASLDLPEFYVIEQAVKLLVPQLMPAVTLILFFLLLAVCAFILTRKNARQIVEESRYDSRFCWYITILFLFSLISFSQVSTFIYFNF